MITVDVEITRHDYGNIFVLELRAAGLKSGHPAYTKSQQMNRAIHKDRTDIDREIRDIFAGFETCATDFVGGLGPTVELKLKLDRILNEAVNRYPDMSGRYVYGLEFRFSQNASPVAARELEVARERVWRHYFGTAAATQLSVMEGIDPPGHREDRIRGDAPLELFDGMSREPLVKEVLSECGKLPKEERARRVRALVDAI